MENLHFILPTLMDLVSLSVSETVKRRGEKKKKERELAEEILPDLAVLCEKVQETAQRCGTEFLKLPLQNPVNGMGTDGHPGVRTQQEIALYVERYMEQMMMWRTDER